MSTFAGFGPEALGFLDGLAADNSKQYFESHRGVYDEQIATPMKTLVVAVGERLADAVDHDVAYEPRVGRSLFRIHRDLRFSKDKTPYQTHLDAIWWTGDVPKESPAFIMRITSDSVLTGAGMHGLRGDRLERYRAAVAGEDGCELAATVAAHRSEHGATISEPSRKRVPKGFDVGDARADLLVRDGFHVSASDSIPTAITDAAFAPWVARRLIRFADVQRWFVRHV